MKNYIPTKKLELPNSGITLEIYTFLSNGEQRDIQKLMMSSGGMKELMAAAQDKESGNKEDILQRIDEKAILAVYDMQDTAFKFAFVGAFDKQGTRLDVGTPEQFLRDMHPGDAEIVYTTIQDVINGSQMSKEEKKI